MVPELRVRERIAFRSVPMLSREHEAAAYTSNREAHDPWIPGWPGFDSQSATFHGHVWVGWFSNTLTHFSTATLHPHDHVSRKKCASSGPTWDSRSFLYCSSSVVYDILPTTLP